jgi:hypothetical protein
VFENMPLGKIFGPKMDDVTGDWKRLHNGIHDWLIKIKDNHTWNTRQV